MYRVLPLLGLVLVLVLVLVLPLGCLCCSFADSGLPNPHVPSVPSSSRGVLSAQRNHAGFNAPKPDSVQAAKIALRMEELTRNETEATRRVKRQTFRGGFFPGSRNNRLRSSPPATAPRRNPPPGIQTGPVTLPVRLDPRLHRDKVLFPVCREEQEEAKCDPKYPYR